jgi:hypothetical protein
MRILGAGEAESLRLGRDLEVASLPLHDVVVADTAIMMNAADAVEVAGGGGGWVVCRNRCAAVPKGGFQAFDLARRKIEYLRSSGTRPLPLQPLRNYGHSLQLFLAQRVCLHRGDIFT